MTSFLVTETTIDTGSVLEVTQYKCAGLRMTVQSDMDYFTIYTDNDAANAVATACLPERIGSRRGWRAYDLDGELVTGLYMAGPRSTLRRVAKRWHAGTMRTKPAVSQ